MRLITGILLLLSLLVIPGNPAMCDTPAPPLQLQQAAPPAQGSPQADDIRDIKGPVPLSAIPGYLIPAAAAVALVILTILVFLYLRGRRQAKTVISPPDVIALTELDRARALMDRPLVYADRISAIMRQYIEARFQIRSTRQTTREFFTRLQDGTTIAEVDIKNHAGDLQACMEQCDIAKFAHGTPDQEGMRGMDQAVRHFIETTRQQENPGAGPNKGAS